MRTGHDRGARSAGTWHRTLHITKKIVALPVRQNLPKTVAVDIALLLEDFKLYGITTD